MDIGTDIPGSRDISPAPDMMDDGYDNAIEDMKDSIVNDYIAGELDAEFIADFFDQLSEEQMQVVRDRIMKLVHADKDRELCDMIYEAMDEKAEELVKWDLAS